MVSDGSRGATSQRKESAKEGWKLARCLRRRRSLALYRLFGHWLRSGPRLQRHNEIFESLDRIPGNRVRLEIDTKSSGKSFEYVVTIEPRGFTKNECRHYVLWATSKLKVHNVTEMFAFGCDDL